MPINEKYGKIFFVKDKSVSYTSDNKTIEYSYQTLGKENDEKMSSDMVKNGDITALSSTYTYDDNGNVAKKAVSYNGGSLDFVNSYDSKDRISSASAFGKTVNYTYDENDQLVSADGDHYNATYSYDARGNITSKVINGTETNFTYSNTGWKDQLISVNGVELTYDANGNVLTYGDKEFLWNTGRHLESITDGDNEYTYSYDENGIRTSKTVNDITTYYNTNDGVILSQTDGTNTMYFRYDNSGTPLGFVYNGIQYFYITNPMGDVLGITEADGNLIAQYLYDEWGKLLSIDTADEDGSTAYREIAEANPLRYRGYYYDNETGYYYLQSRYYDSDIGRFINADVPEIADFSRDIPLGVNLFAYCSNNPVNGIDASGKGPLQTILDVFSRALDTLTKVVDFIAASCAKSAKALKDKASRYRKAKNQRKALNEIVDQSNKLSKKLGKIGRIVTGVAIITGLISTLKSGAHWTVTLVKIVVDILIEGICDGISTVCKKLVQFIPGFGFILGVIAGIGASWLLSRYFTDYRISKIANTVYKDIKNKKITSMKYFLKVTLKNAFVS